MAAENEGEGGRAAILRLRAPLRRRDALAHRAAGWRYGELAAAVEVFVATRDLFAGHRPVEVEEQILELACRLLRARSACLRLDGRVRSMGRGSGAGARSMCVLTEGIRGRDRALGTLLAARETPFDRVDARRAGILAEQAGLALENARAHAELESRAEVDELTGLYSRRHLFDALLRAGAEPTPGTSFLMVDVDWFKQVNDQYGHARGDRVLRRVASRLAHATRARDVVARVGGEEFAVLLPRTDGATAAEVAERIRASVARGTRAPRVTVSIGVASIDGPLRGRGRDVRARAMELMERADAALYAAKRAGRDRVRVWSRELAPLGRRRVS